jgi:hypothetical protein
MDNSGVLTAQYTITGLTGQSGDVALCIGPSIENQRTTVTGGGEKGTR